MKSALIGWTSVSQPCWDPSAPKVRSTNGRCSAHKCERGLAKGETNQSGQPEERPRETSNHNVHIATPPWSDLDGSDASTTGEEDDNDIYGVNDAADGAARVNIVKCQKLKRLTLLPTRIAIVVASKANSDGFGNITTWREKQMTMTSTESKLGQIQPHFTTSPPGKYPPIQATKTCLTSWTYGPRASEWTVSWITYSIRTRDLPTNWISTPRYQSWAEQ